jgi:hypothetical protein
MQQTVIHIGVCAVYLHKSSVKFTNLFLGSPLVLTVILTLFVNIAKSEDTRGPVFESRRVRYYLPDVYYQIDSIRLIFYEETDKIRT